MRLPRHRLTSGRLMIFAGSLAVVVAGLFLLRGYAYRAAMRGGEAYNAEMERLHKDYQRRMRGAIALLRQAQSDGQNEMEATDRLFELLRLSAAANNSREVETWEKAPHSADRTAMALKWAEVAANEAAYMGELHERWRWDHERGLPSHHITDDEVQPFQMPVGWTQNDLKWDLAERNE